LAQKASNPSFFTMISWRVSRLASYTTRSPTRSQAVGLDITDWELQSVAYVMRVFTDDSEDTQLAAHAEAIPISQPQFCIYKR
jgi:hypothetical protein